LQAEENSGQETHSTSQGREAQRKTQSWRQIGGPCEYFGRR